VVDDSNAQERQEKELAYYKKQLNETALANAKLEMVIAGVRHEIRQKRQGFSLLSRLQQTVGMQRNISDIFEITIADINSTLGMEKTLVLTPTDKENVYRPSHWIGFDEILEDRMSSLSFEFPKEFATGAGLFLVNKATSKTPLIQKIQSDLDVPFFICLPVVLEEIPIALLLSGRMLEMKPFYPPLDQGDVDTLQAIAALISSCLRIRRIAVLEEKIEAQMADLKLAANIQSDLLPKTAPELEDYEIAGRNIPAKMVGGDYFDFIQIDAHRVVIALGDVCGKGLPASLLMANTQATIRGQAFTYHKTNRCLERTNSLLYQRTDKKTFVSLFYSILDTQKHKLKYANAGQNLPLLFSSGQLPIYLENSGLVLGVFNNVKYTEESIMIQRGDVLVIYSDGICEAMNDEKEEFGEQRLQEIVLLHKEAPADILVEKIISAIELFNQGAPQNDDMTLVVVKRK